MIRRALHASGPPAGCRSVGLVPWLAPTALGAEARDPGLTCLAIWPGPPAPGYSLEDQAGAEPEATFMEGKAEGVRKRPALGASRFPSGWPGLAGRLWVGVLGGGGKETQHFQVGPPPDGLGRAVDAEAKAGRASRRPACTQLGFMISLAAPSLVSWLERMNLSLDGGCLCADGPGFLGTF